MARFKVQQVGRPNILLLIVVVFTLYGIFNLFRTPGEDVTNIKNYNEFIDRLQKGEFPSVETIEQTDGLSIIAKDKNGKKYSAFGSKDGELQKFLRGNKNINWMPQPVPQPSWLLQIFLWLLPIGLFFLLFALFARKSVSNIGNGIQLFGKSKAKLYENTNKITFADVAGIDEAKEDVQDVIKFLCDPRKFSALGGKMPKGILLMGPPGTGKTLLAKAMAGEANVPFFSISGSDFVEMFVGVGAARVRDLFEQGKKTAPCIIFIDELDAVGRHRGAGLGGGNDEREQTLNQLLVEMDGFESQAGLVLVAATNRPDVLDPALLRPGRFDRHIVVPRPDTKGREQILKIHAKKIKLAEGVDLGVIARGTPGFVGADLENIINEAALMAAKLAKTEVGLAELEEAKEKIIMGSERKSVVISEFEKKLTAYHESGHTVVAKHIFGADPVQKVTIVPRGLAGGFTLQIPEADRHFYSKTYLDGQIMILMGGRVAEEKFIGDMSTGAQNDIEKATEIAHKMVCEWGMSNLGTLKFGQSYENPFLGKQVTELSKNYSEKTAEDIDAEIVNIIADGYQKASDIIEEYKEQVEALARALLEKETLDGAQINEILETAGQ